MGEASPRGETDSEDWLAIPQMPPGPRAVLSRQQHHPLESGRRVGGLLGGGLAG